MCTHTRTNTHTLTEGMAKISDAADVNARACRRSDTKPATAPPVYVQDMKHNTFSKMAQNHTCNLVHFLSVFNDIYVHMHAQLHIFDISDMNLKLL